RTATGLTSVPGSEPPDHAIARSPARWLHQPSAICDRPALCTQRNSTTGTPSSGCVERASVLGIGRLPQVASMESCGTTTSSPDRSGWRYHASAIATAPPTTGMTTKAGTDDHAIPAKVLLNVRPIVTAGFAKLVD